MFEPAQQLLSGVSVDTPIHRVFPLRRALQLFVDRSLVLVRPSQWDDPFENFLLGATLDFGNGESASLASLRDSWYGQCWTREAESDAMWRIYSHDKTSVRLSTTVGKLLEAVCPTPDKWSSLEFFVGEVGYHTQDEIVEALSKLTFMEIISGGQADRLAQTLLIKREAFAHEKEVRVLFNDSQGRHAGAMVAFPIDPVNLVEEVMFDPRLDPVQVAAATGQLQAAGYAGLFSQSQLYRLPSLTIRAE